MPEAPVYLSPSSIGTYRSCPQKFKLSRIDRIPEPPTWATELGTFVHEVLEHLYQQPADSRTVDGLRTLAGRLWSENDWEDKVVALNDPTRDTRDFKVAAFASITNLWTLEDPQRIELDGMEHEVECEVEGVILKGYIDRFVFAEDGSVIISDYKTGKVPNPRFTPERDKFFQLLAYALMLDASDQETTSKVQLYYLNEPAVHELEVTPRHLSVATGTIVETREAIDASLDAGSFHCNVTKLCDWCHYKTSRICPAFADS